MTVNYSCPCRQRCSQTKCIEITMKNQNKIALNPAQKWLIFAHIPAEKSVVTQNALKLPKLP